MTIEILDEAENDLQDGRDFYDRQEPGVGDYFAAALASGIDALMNFALLRSVNLRLLASERGEVLAAPLRPRAIAKAAMNENQEPWPSIRNRPRNTRMQQGNNHRQELGTEVGIIDA